MIMPTKRPYKIISPSMSLFLEMWYVIDRENLIENISDIKPAALKIIQNFPLPAAPKYLAVKIPRIKENPNSIISPRKEITMSDDIFLI